ELRAERDRLPQKFPGAGLARLQVARRAHGAHTGNPPLQRDLPEPPVLEPEYADIALVAPGEGCDAGEMTEQGGAAVARVAPLDAQLGGEQRIASRGVDEIAGFPDLLAAFRPGGVDDAAAGPGEADVRYPAFLYDGGALAGTISQQNVVERGARHLIGVRPRLVQRVGEEEILLPAVVGRAQLGAVLHHGDRFDLAAHAEGVEQWQVHGQQRLADMEAGMAVFLEQCDAPALFREHGCGRRAGGPAADHQHVAVLRDSPGLFPAGASATFGRLTAHCREAASNEPWACTVATQRPGSTPFAGKPA